MTIRARRADVVVAGGTGAAIHPLALACCRTRRSAATRRATSRLFAFRWSTGDGYISPLHRR
ncbi:beta-ketoacyl synthase N-terminal-like domain-containing protein [Frankia sp. AgKG'84/4]|uniref:beta-ketoacyl synthase N-terminal-like domain-containing protein n=1 Tax=Frankia sp. AgKG'84/4 TaxID=573490 RepID=UPI0035B267F3